MRQGAERLAGLAGFALGNAAAILAAVLFVLSLGLERLMRGVGVVLFAIPAIALGPVLVITLRGDGPQVALAAVSVYFPTMVATLLGLGRVDPRPVDVVRLYGGGPLALLRLLRWRSALPGLLGGLRPAATPVAGLAFALLSGLAAGLARGTVPVTMPLPAPRPAAAGGWPDRLLALASLLMPFILWQAALLALGASPVVARGPLRVLAGLALGLGCALVLQTMPLVALTPLIVLLLGRDVLATLAITVSVTFFPAFLTIAQGLAQAPRAGRELLPVYGASPWQVLRYLALPYALPHICAAARLVAPRALLGVMIAEWLATGYGLGNLLNEARGELDYGMIWDVCLVAAAISVGFYQAVEAVERRVLARYG